MQTGIPDRERSEKDRKTILREEKVKKEKKRKKIEEVRKVKRELSREVTVKIRLERVNMQKRIMLEALLNSIATGSVMSSKFAKKQGFELKNFEKPIYIRNVNEMFNKEGPIENTVKVNIYYWEYREKTEINVISE